MLPARDQQREELSTDVEPDALARGWVVPPGGTKVEALFVLSGTNLGIGRTERVTPPVWLDLDELVALDAIGEPADGLTQVEMVMADQRAIGAGWPDDFVGAVVAALEASAADSSPPSADPAEHPHATAHTAPDDGPSDGPGPTGGAPAHAEAEADAGPAAGPDVRFDVVDPRPIVAASAEDTPTVPTVPSASLELEDVVYLGGYPGQSKRRKRCTVAMTRSGVDLSGPGDLRLRIGWDVVRTIEVQNSDEARFRMNTKIHRDASALVIECEQGVTLLLEARDCPTIALRSAIAQLLVDLPVVVV